MCFECLEFGVLSHLQTAEEDEVRQFETCLSNTGAPIAPTSTGLLQSLPQALPGPREGSWMVVGGFQQCFGLWTHVITALGLFSCQE